jgi:acyl carrier protein
MDRTELLQSLRDIVARSVGNEISEIDETKNLREDLGLDSIDFVSIVIEIQSEFDVELKNEDLMGLVTVKDLLDLIIAKVAAKSSAPNAESTDATAGEHRAA